MLAFQMTAVYPSISVVTIFFGCTVLVFHRRPRHAFSKALQARNYPVYSNFSHPLYHFLSYFFLFFPRC